MEVHIVQKGETLWKIARHFGISFDELKRVNAHLANPDYIVPGMKIFLPEKSVETNKKEANKPSKEAEVVKKTEKEPSKVAPSPVEEVKVPEQPKPTYEKPKAPEVPRAPETSAQPMHHMQHPIPPMQPMQQQMPFVGVPCGWMPIFDADCFPFVQPSHMQQQVPTPAHQLPVEPESPVHTNLRPTPMPLPEENVMPDGWKLLESPNLQFEENLTTNEPSKIHFEESATLKEEEQVEELAVPAPPQFQMPIAQEAPMQGGYGYQPYPQMGHGQGHQYPQGSPCNSCGQYHPPPPVQPVNHCNACNQPIQTMPSQMMPYPPRNNNWPGNY